MIMNHKIFTSLIKPPLPLGLTQGYIAFLMIATGIFLPFVLFIQPWFIIAVLALFITLFFIGKSKIKKDWQYFAVLWLVIKKQNFDPKIYKTEIYRK